MQSDMLYYIIGSATTLIILLVGIVAGYIIGSNRLDRSIRKIRNRLKRPIDSEPLEVGSGPVKIKTKIQQATESDEEIKRQKQLIE